MLKTKKIFFHSCNQIFLMSLRMFYFFQPSFLENQKKKTDLFSDLNKPSNNSNKPTDQFGSQYKNEPFGGAAKPGRRRWGPPPRGSVMGDSIDDILGDLNVDKSKPAQKKPAYKPPPQRRKSIFDDDDDEFSL